MRFFVHAFPWDLLDAGLDAALDHLKGQIGISGVTVPVVLPAVCQLRTEKFDPVIFQSVGGLFFEPTAEQYVGTQIKPVAASWKKAKTALPKIAAACAARKLSLRAALHVTTPGQLASKYPQLAAQNLLGSVSATKLCPSHPDVQEWIIRMCTDLSAIEEIDSLLLDDFATGWTEDFIAPPILPGPLDLLHVAREFCFCEACHRETSKIGIDLLALQKTLRTWFVEASNGQRPSEYGDLIEDLVADEGFHRMVQWSGALSGKLLKDCRHHWPRELVVNYDRLPQYTVETGLDAVDTVTVSEWDEMAKEELSAFRERGRVEQHRDVRWVGEHSPDEIVRECQAVARATFDGIELSTFGSISEGKWDSIRQAIRFARRQK